MSKVQATRRKGPGGRPAGERALDRELARISREEASSAGEDLSDRERGAIAREILDIFFNIWIRFAVDLGRELRMTPFQWDFVMYDGGKRYRLRSGFNYARVSEMILEEPAFPFRHMLKAELRPVGGRTYVRVGLILEEGREYERISTVVAHTNYIIYNQPAKRFSPKGLKAALSEPLRVWIRSQVRQDPPILWDFCHEKLRRG